MSDRITIKQMRKIIVDVLSNHPKVFEVHTNKDRHFENYPDDQISIVTQGNCEGCGACDGCQDPSVFTFTLIDVYDNADKEGGGKDAS